MPTYQYRCRECDEDLEVVQSFTDDPLTKCPNCKKKALRKVFAAPGIAFKGSGFYKNDSRSGATKGSSSSANGSAGDKGDTSDKGDGSDKGGEAKKDAKAATTSDSSSGSAAKATTTKSSPSSSSSD